ncbi:MAG: metallophosphoesterase [Ornithinimicrobium sp.]
MVTFLHTADWQIGITRRWLQPEAQARFDHDRLEAIRDCGRIARDQHCEFVLVAGDVFESNQLRPRTVLRALEAMGDIEVPVYLLPGNHDPLDALSVYRQPTFIQHCPGNVTVLETAGVTPVRSGVDIVAAPWSGKHPGQDPVAGAMASVPATEGVVRIVAGHGAVDVLDPTGRNPQAIDTSALMAAHAQGLIHYVALGDRHSRTDVGGHGVIWYSGTMEVTDSREEAPGDVLVVSVDQESPPEVAAHRTGRWHFSTMLFDLNSGQDVTDLIESLHRIKGKERVVLKLALQGVLAMADFTRLNQALDSFREVFGGLDDWSDRGRLTVLPADYEWSELGLSGFVADAAQEITDQGDTDGSQDALALLFRLSAGSSS